MVLVVPFPASREPTPRREGISRNLGSEICASTLVRAHEGSVGALRHGGWLRRWPRGTMHLLQPENCLGRA